MSVCAAQQLELAQGSATGITSAASLSPAPIDGPNILFSTLFPLLGPRDSVCVRHAR